MDINEIATKADIQKVLKAIEDLRNASENQRTEKEFLRSSDVRKILNISHSTLQRLRISGRLNAKKLNGTWFYKRSNLLNLIEDAQAE